MPVLLEICDCVFYFIYFFILIQTTKLKHVNQQTRWQWETIKVLNMGNHWGTHTLVTLLLFCAVKLYYVAHDANWLETHTMLCKCVFFEMPFRVKTRRLRSPSAPLKTKPTIWLRWSKFYTNILTKKIRVKKKCC